MEYKIDKEKILELKDDFEELEKLLTERISDLHNVQGGIQARHAYIFYRKELRGVRSLLFDNLKVVEEDKTT